ncbi:hypothetical protein GX50_01132 [[Emmonsia] crescens]|uniref:Major facilitator superfamily (MFS) profile domain-containing protein n=1 Tax=[Emmonsia] crescens TaxID=73230 RepID=A0A2B7ZSI1_9EURO|nr:hypothetical protein GX50_01132 [Emmonsia crescens]
MITPVMVANIGWGTYLFFGAWNAIFIPFIWFFYPETAGRSLEKTEVIFAKGYVEKMNYVKAAKELPKLTDGRLRERVRNMASWTTRIMKRWKSMSAPIVLVLHNLSCKERFYHILHTLNIQSFSDTINMADAFISDSFAAESHLILELSGPRVPEI